MEHPETSSLTGTFQGIQHSISRWFPSLRGSGTFWAVLLICFIINFIDINFIYQKMHFKCTPQRSINILLNLPPQTGYGPFPSLSKFSYAPLQYWHKARHIQRDFNHFKVFNDHFMVQDRVHLGECSTSF